MIEKKENRNATHADRIQSIIFYLQETTFTVPMQPEAIHKSIVTT